MRGSHEKASKQHFNMAVIEPEDNIPDDTHDDPNDGNSSDDSDEGTDDDEWERSYRKEKAPAPKRSRLCVYVTILTPVASRKVHLLGVG